MSSNAEKLPQKLLRIVPHLDNHESGEMPQRCQGTAVYCGDAKVDGVVSITLHAKVDDIWRATIECIVIPPESIAVEGNFVEVDVTTMSDSARVFERVKA